MSERGLRYNSDKIRIELVPSEIILGVAKVLTYGANKYTVKNEDGSIVTDGANNWRKGLSWMDTFASCQRHLMAFKDGIDNDEESACLHLEHAATNIAFLLAFYKSYNEGDDRIKRSIPKVGLDIDEVLCDFTKGWSERWKDVSDRPDTWYYDRNMLNRFEEMRNNNELDEFYLLLEQKMTSADIPFEPSCYVTSRPVSTEVTEKWLDAHGFPRAKIYTVPVGVCKSTVIKEANIDIFVDDCHLNYFKLNAAGINCYLWDAPHNQRFNVGYKRIKNLKELL